MCDSVRRLCRESATSCTKSILREIFSIDKELKNSNISRDTVPEEVRVEELEDQRKKKCFLLLQEKIAQCRDPTELVQLLRRTSEVNSLLLEDEGSECSSDSVGRQAAAGGELSESEVEGQAAAAGAELSQSETHCCHYHDIQ